MEIERWTKVIIAMKHPVSWTFHYSSIPYVVMTIILTKSRNYRRGAVVGPCEHVFVADPVW